jgi:Glucose-6-phosphate dehydrogenase, C-terminal domain
VATPAAETMRSQTVRGRYTAGTIGTRQVPSYVDEPGVDPSRNTETYASLTLRVNSPRWHEVPFTLRSGKALAADSAEIAIHFRPLPRYLLDQWPGVEPNVLTVGLTEPYVRLSTTLNGPERTAEIRQLEARSTPPRFTAYAHLILDMLNSNPMLFIRGDEAEEAWRIIDPAINAWTAGNVPMQEIPSRPSTTRTRQLTPQQTDTAATSPTLARARTDTPNPPARAQPPAHALPAEPARSQRSRRREAPSAMAVLACRSSIRCATDSHPDNRGRRAERRILAHCRRSALVTNCDPIPGLAPRKTPSMRSRWMLGSPRPSDAERPILRRLSCAALC